MTAATPRRRTRTFAALALGAATGATTSAGIALLLYTGQGFLRAAGLLYASTILALAAGLWAGAPEPTQRTLRSGPRWLALFATLLLGGMFTIVWSARGELRALALGGAVAVLLVLALPAYAAGALLAAIQTRNSPRSVAATALTGAAIGVLVTTMLLIQNLEPFTIYHGAAVLMLLLGIGEARAPAPITGAHHMQGRVAIITGVGERGQLGFAIAQKCLDAGAQIVISGRSASVIELATALSPADNVYAVTADLTSDDDVARLIDTARERFGKLDALINVAGGLSVIASVAETTPEMWQREIQRNAETALRTSRAALPWLREARGAIVNFTSPAGERASANLAAYSAAKAAVIALTRALALEEKAHGVRVNAIAPGLMDTAQNRASAQPDTVFVPRHDVAEVALFLAGPASAGVTGEVVHVLGETLS